MESVLTDIPGTPAPAASMAPPLNQTPGDQSPGEQMEQKASRTRIHYRFFEDYVEYNIRDRRGGKASFNARYVDLPSRFDYRLLQMRGNRMLPATIVVMIVSICALMQDKSSSFETLMFCVIYGGFVLGISYWLQQRQKRLYTTMPTKSGKLLILKDARHDDVVNALEARRKQALRKLAVIDPYAPPQQEFNRLAWLREEGAITAEELDSYRDRLGLTRTVPAAGTGGADEKPMLVKSQKGFRLRNEFGFYDRHLSFMQDDGALSAFNIWYRDLPHVSEYRKFSKSETYGAIVFAAGMILAIAYLNHHASDNYFTGDAGLMRLGVAAAIFLPLLVGLVYLTQRYTRKAFTIIPVSKGMIRVLQDAQHDDILEQIQRRRIQALREHAVINHLNAPQAELKKFAWLKEQGAITGNEFENFRRLIIDEHDPAPPKPASKPPRETLH